MKRWNNIAGCLLVVAAGFFIFGTDVFAAEETGGGWRETYDMVLRWINFVILAVIIVKYARKPLKDFIFGQRKNLIRELERKEGFKYTVKYTEEAQWFKVFIFSRVFDPNIIYTIWLPSLFFLMCVLLMIFAIR